MTTFSSLFRPNRNICWETFSRYKKPHKPWDNYNTTKKFRKNLWLMNGGILLAVFAGCYMMVPLYRSFCQATGLIGDNMQKDYSKIVKEGQKRI
jgi:cytochrome c oxidase assembly protein Cox11